MHHAETTVSPSVFKRIASLFYEALTIIALAFVGVGLFVSVFGDASQAPTKRIAMQLFIWLLLGAYYVISWVKQGQSLAMRSWHIKVVPAAPSQQHRPLSVPTAIARYVLATCSVGILGLGFLIGLLPNRQFLHDQLLQLCQIDTKKTNA